MASFLTLVLPALVPVASDAIRSVVARLTMGAGALPQSVDDRIKLMGAENDKLKALAELDRPTGEVSRWVANFRASFRYFAVSGILAATIAGAFWGLDAAVLTVLLDLSGACMSFIIGERMYLGLKK